MNIFNYLIKEFYHIDSNKRYFKMKQKKIQSWIDELLEDVDADPIVENFSLLGIMETLIRTSINSDEEKDALVEDIQYMHKTEFDALMMHLKENQVYRDCKEQFKQMCYKGVFKQKNKMMNKDNVFIKTLRFHGVSKRELGTELKLSQPTIKTYCENPQLFRLNQLKTIGKLTDLNLLELEKLISKSKK